MTLRLFIQGGNLKKAHAHPWKSQGVMLYIDVFFTKEACVYTGAFRVTGGIGVTRVECMSAQEKVTTFRLASGSGQMISGL